MKKKFVKGCIIFMLVCLSGCGQSASPATEETDAAEEMSEETETTTTESTTEEMVENDSSEETDDGEKPETEKSSGTVSGQLSEDMYSFQIQVGEDVFQFPSTYQDFADKGYVCDNPDRQELDPGLYLVQQEFVKGENTLFVGIVNLTQETQPIENCSAVSISVDSNYIGNDEPIIMPKGIQLGGSSLEDIIAAYGEPSETYEGDAYTTIVYNRGYFQELEFMIDTEANAVCKMDMENMPE